MSEAPGGRTLLDKIWDAHLVSPESEAAPATLYIDLHLLHELHVGGLGHRVGSLHVAHVAFRFN